MYPSKYLPSLSYVKVNGNTLLNILKEETSSTGTKSSK
jgi:hypothetical protein